MLAIFVLFSILTQKPICFKGVVPPMSTLIHNNSLSYTFVGATMRLQVFKRH